MEVIKYGAIEPRLKRKRAGLKEVLDDYLEFLGEVESDPRAFNAENFVQELKVNLKSLKAKWNLLRKGERVGGLEDIVVMYAVISPRGRKNK